MQIQKCVLDNHKGHTSQWHNPVLSLQSGLDKILTSILGFQVQKDTFMFYFLETFNAGCGGKRTKLEMRRNGLQSWLLCSLNCDLMTSLLPLQTSSFYKIMSSYQKSYNCFVLYCFFKDIKLTKTTHAKSIATKTNSKVSTFFFKALCGPKNLRYTSISSQVLTKQKYANY